MGSLVPIRVPGVYRRAVRRVQRPLRVRTDVAGFVGIAGPQRLHEAVAIEDWRTYQLTYLRDDQGRPIDPPAGATLADQVRAFFTNGGDRCWVVNIGSEVDASLADLLLLDMLGLDRTALAPPLPKRTGLELLLQQDEVAIVVLPDLDASIETPLEGGGPSATGDGRFHCCPGVAPLPADQAPPLLQPSPLFTPKQIADVQRYLIDRCSLVRWRVFVLLAPPSGCDLKAARAWRHSIAPFANPDDELDEKLATAGLYWPWLLAEDVPGQAVQERSPVGAVAGLFARADLTRGPAAPPANETVLAIVGLQVAVDDDANSTAYDEGINVLRSFPGIGIQLWGARTLLCTGQASLDANPLGYVNVRRGLSAIERSVERIGQAAVFEPNLPLLRAQVAQAVVGYLLDMFAAGALAGSTPEQSFFVRCDDGNNTADTIDAGQLICEVGVAIAAPAEFIVFRVGRSDGVVEITEELA
jgi:uncharacterized protein